MDNDGLEKSKRFIACEKQMRISFKLKKKCLMAKNNNKKCCISF